MKLDDLYTKAHTLYEQGKYEQIFLLFHQLAEQGDTFAMSRVAIMYECGEGVHYDLDKSIFWDMKAIQAGYNTSMLNLGMTFRRMGNIEQAKYWFFKAFDTGDDEAALELVRLYSVSEKETEIIRYYANKVIYSDNVCENSIEKAEEILKELPALTQKLL